LTRLRVAVTVAGVELDIDTITGLSDADLARLIASAAPGRDAAESELYRRFAPRVRLYGLKHLRDEDAARDLVQQVMLVTIERLRAGAVRDPEQIGSFILGASRLTADAQQRTLRRRQAILGHLPPSASPEAPYAPSLDLDRVERCLSALRERERAVLILTFYEERVANDIARALTMTIGAVRVLRHRALGRMRQCIDERSRS
jgi:RNA polymerase sigma-70 factor (ECF subfamily)